MKFVTPFFTAAFFVLFACNSQNLSPTTTGSTDENNSALISGDTVHEISNAIMVIHQDKKNNYWFGSKGQGVYRFDGELILNFTMKDGLVSNEIWGIQEDKSGNLFFDTQDGVSRFDGRTFTTLHVSDSSSEWKGIEVDDLWFKGNWNKNGTYRYDGQTLHLLVFPKNEMAEAALKNFPNMTWSPYGIYTIYKDKKGNPWFGLSNGGIYRYSVENPGTPGWMYEDHLTNVPNGGSFGIRSVYEDHLGNFWFCNTNYRYKIYSEDSAANGMRFIRSKKESGIDNVNAANGKNLFYYLSVTEDNNHDLWMVTYDEGVWRYDGKNLKHYLIQEDGKAVTLYTIYKDNIGVLWLGSHEHGAYKFNGSTFEKFRM